PAQVQASQIRVEAVGDGGIDSEILAPGTVAGAPDGQAVLTAGAAGTVSRIFKRPGDPVRAGETVATVVSREGAGLAADRSVAAARASLARQQLAREKRLFEQGVSPRQDFEIAQTTLVAAEAEARRANVSAGAARVTRDGGAVSVVSPINGRLTSASASLGAFVQPETELFRVADPRRIQVEAAISAADMGRLRPGGRARVTTGDGRELNATVRSVTPAVDEETRQATAVLAVEGIENLAPGQLVRTRLFAAVANSSPGFAVPQNAVQNVDGKDVVFVRTDKGFRAQPVQVVRRSAGRVQVSGGLTPGQLIATDNAFLLKSELGKAATE
ncbi:MAG TPA: efflux RND transporter periplasmic adaptor subunit, partial [Phenylobacterium sp.]|nr:efflux RND transporter periplasmic adaptor subunit [Phenylobacterium sp.]